MPDEEITVTFQPSGKRISVPPGTTLLEAARMCGEYVPSICGGRGLCGKCRVMVLDSKAVNRPTRAEEELLGRHSRGMRLACLTVPRNDLIVEIPAESREASPEILIQGLDYQVNIDPIVTKHYLEIPAPSLEDPVADFERLRRSLRGIGIELEEEGLWCLRHGSDVMRRADWKLTAAVWHSKRLVRIQGGDTTNCSLGAAIDIGTTTVVCHLVDLNTGETVASDSALNPQIPYGEDVVTRLAFQLGSRKNGNKLQSLVVMEISRLIERCCSRVGVDVKDVLEVSIAGNTVMHHIALGLPSAYLGVSPFSPVVRSGIDVTAKDIGLKLHPDTPVHALPVLAGYVGADTCAVILSSRIYESEDTAMAIDIGTNGEIVMGGSKGLTVTSCAAGPALEGAHIRFGMRAAEGAIQSVRIRKDEVIVKTIGDKPPVGLAGSGIIDAVAEMLKAGVIGRDGRFRDHPRVRSGNGMKEFPLVEASDTGLESDIVMTQKDIREVQLAKAAIFTGACALMEASGKKPGDISTLYVAGAFGNYIDFDSAKTIGLIPDIPTDRIRFIGNGSVIGAKLTLLSRSLREVAEHVADKVNYLELTCTTNFSSNYMDATYLPHKDLDRFPSLRGVL